MSTFVHDSQPFTRRRAFGSRNIEVTNSCIKKCMLTRKCSQHAFSFSFFLGIGERNIDQGLDLVQPDLVMTPPGPFSSSDIGLFHAGTNNAVVAAGSLECFVRVGWEHAPLDAFVASHGGWRRAIPPGVSSMISMRFLGPCRRSDSEDKGYHWSGRLWVN